ncbi:MAG: tetratricopeptide repeat protein [Bacteroidota bacterium]|nr:tetratricopeptide repeat protein [Bacteroidota bacterium]
MEKTEHSPEETPVNISPEVETDYIAEETQAETFLTKNKNILTYGLGGIMLLIFGIWAYNYFVLTPKEKEAQTALYPLQMELERDSTGAMLKPGPMGMSITEVADEYSATETGNLAAYTAGVALMHEGKYKEAIEYLEDFNTSSKLHEPLSLGLIGDAYSQLKNYEDAADYYIRAAKADDNAFTASMYYKKAGLVYEELGEYEDAVDAYQTIKDDYPQSEAGTSIDKYLMRAKARVDYN